MQISVLSLIAMERLGGGGGGESREDRDGEMERIGRLKAGMESVGRQEV